MLPALQQLLILQDRDQKIRNLRNELKAMPAERLSLETRLAKLTAQLDAAKQRQREIEVDRKGLELEAQAKRDSIARFKTQQFQTRKNEEFQALSNEIKRFEGQIQTLEDRELDLMQETEEVKVNVTAADREFATGKALIAKQVADVATKTTALEEQLKALESSRPQLAEPVDEDLLFRYDRLFKSKGDAAVVALENEICTGCHMKVTTQTSVKTKGGLEIVGCEQCGRLLYFSEY